MAVYTRVNSKDINYIEKNYNIGTVVNIEIDILARYLESLNSN